MQSLEIFFDLPSVRSMIIDVLIRRCTVSRLNLGDLCTTAEETSRSESLGKYFANEIAKKLDSPQYNKKIKGNDTYNKKNKKIDGKIYVKNATLRDILSLLTPRKMLCIMH